MSIWKKIYDYKVSNNHLSNKSNDIYAKQCKDKDKQLDKFIDEKNKINKSFINYRIERCKDNYKIKLVVDLNIKNKKYYCITPYSQRYNIYKKILYITAIKHRK